MSEKEADPNGSELEKTEGSKPDSCPPPVSSRTENLTIVTSSSSPSFSQLLAGAMSPATGPPPVLVVPLDGVTTPVVSVPCFLAPASLLESSGFTGKFAMTHQAVLATVTAQAQMQLQTTYTKELANSFPQPLQSRAPTESEENFCTPETEQPPLSDQKTPSSQVVVKSGSVDGYNWRKYGQKQVKTSDRSRSYYKCTYSSCLAKKKVERRSDGQETEIVYMGNHNHDQPQKTRCLKERSQPGGPSRENECLDIVMADVNESDPSTSKAEQNSGNETPDPRLYCSSDCEGDTAAVKAEEDPSDEPDPKRRLNGSIIPISAPVLRTIKEPKIVVQSESEAGHINDGYRWRKYGQKIVKGNPNPRSYYRCTYHGCPVRKHVERASVDAKAIIITYEGKHNHTQPPPRNGSDQPASVLIAATSGEPIQASESVDQKGPTDEKASSELGGQTLLSIGINSTSGEEVHGTNTDGINRPLFDEKCSAAPVQTS